MILWKDFLLDDVLGAVLHDNRDLPMTRSSVMEDATTRVLIQETRREALPLQAANTGCVRDLTQTSVRAQGFESNLETNTLSHMDVESEFADLRSRGAG